MKLVAIVVTNLAGSGAEKIAISQAKLFKKEGCNVVLFILEDVQTYDSALEAIDIVPLTKRKNTFKMFGKWGDRIYAAILQSKMKQYGNFDLVISNLPRADRVVKLLKHPNKYFVIHMSYKAELEKFKASRAEKKLKLYQYLYRGENLITITDAMIEDLHYLDIAYQSVQTIYNPFDFEYIRKRGEEPVEIGYDYVISPSAFREQKRYDILLDAFSNIKTGIKLVILATPHPKLVEMIKERGLEERVEILGFQQNPYKYIKQAKLLVLASDREGLPTILIESLILGTPVVSTDCPTGPSEILTGALSQWLVPVGDAESLSKKIDEALASDIVIAQTAIEKFHQNSVAKQFMHLLEHKGKSV
jgi:glycosyltransferase involved in cell wall biosynthesis